MQIGRGPTTPCPECGVDVAVFVRGGTRTFCCPAHKQAYNNRMKAEGAAVIALAKAWRKKRGSGETAKAAFAELTGILDLFNARDAEEGRPSVEVYAQKLLDQGRYIDRERPGQRREQQLTTGEDGE